MTITVSLGPTPRLQFIDNLGNPAAFAQLFTYNWNTRQPKPTYQDPGALIFWSNPIELDDVGRPQGQIYWETDVPYYLELRTNTGAIIWITVEPYVPSSDGGSNVTTLMECCNLFINGQFRYFPIGEYSPLPASIPDLADGGWSFQKDGTNPTASLTFKQYTLDNTIVPASPKFYLNYVADEPGVSETKNDIIFTMSDVRTLSNNVISVGINARSAISGTYTIAVLAIQNFGTGGSPSAPVVTTIFNITLTTTAQTYTGSITLPDLVGKTLGTNGDDSLQISFRLPINSNANIELTNAYFKRGAPYLDYPYRTADEENAIIKALEFPDYTRTTDFNTDTTTYSSEMAYYALTLLPNQGILQPAWLPNFPIGGCLIWLTETPPVGFILMEGQPLLRYGQYYRLFQVIGTLYGSPLTPLNNLGANSSGSNLFPYTLSPGVVNPTLPGTTPFTIEQICAGYNSRIGQSSISGNVFTFVNSDNGAYSPVAASGNSTLTVTVISNGSSSAAARWSLQGKAANVLTPGTYLPYESSTGSYYVYLIIDGVGVDPAIPGRIGKFARLNNTDTDIDVMFAVARAVLGLEYTNIKCTPAIQILPGQYFQIGIVGTDYAPWYAIDGAGAAPGILTPVRIDILGTDSAIEIATKTANALNPLLWQLPDTRGLFMRVWNHGSARDPDAASRGALSIGSPTGDHVGSYQADEFNSHTHEYVQAGGPELQSGSSTECLTTLTTAQTLATGGNETRPKNFYIALAVKY